MTMELAGQVQLRLALPGSSIDWPHYTYRDN